MVDTVRTRSALLNTLFADSQGAGEITPQDMRDLIVSTYGITGWADYVDDEYSTGSPQSISASSFSTIENNGGTSREQELPLDRQPGLYDPSTDSIIGNAGDGILVTVEFTLRRASGSGSFSFTTAIDIGEEGVGEILLYQRSRTLTGADDKIITFSTGAYTLDTWETNGGRLKINPSVDIEIFGSRFIIHRLHKGQGTYPPA